MNKFEIAYVFIPPQRVVYATATGAYARSAKRAWAHMLDWAEKRVPRKSLDLGIGIIRDDSRKTLEHARRYDACLPLMPGLDADLPAGIATQTVRGGPFAVYRHRGSYDLIRDGFVHIRDNWLIGHGLCVDENRPFIEVYLNHPEETHVDDLVVDLCVPVLTLSRYLPPPKRLIAEPQGAMPRAMLERIGARPGAAQADHMA